MPGKRTKEKRGWQKVTVIELVALICGILGFAAGAFSAVFVYAHTMASHANL